MRRIPSRICLIIRLGRILVSGKAKHLVCEVCFESVDDWDANQIEKSAETISPACQPLGMFRGKKMPQKLDKLELTRLLEAPYVAFSWETTNWHWRRLAREVGYSFFSFFRITDIY